jgi:hypothetical protein
MKAVFDTQAMPLGADGLGRFFWPLWRHEQARARDELMAGIVRIAKARGDIHDAERDLFSAIAQLVARENLILFTICAVANRTRAAGREPVWPPGNADCEAIWDGQAPDLNASPSVRTLQRAPAPYPRWRRLAVRLAHDLRLNGFGWRALRSRNPDTDVYACNITPILETHARCVDRPVKYTLFDEWFLPVAPAEQDACPLDAAIRMEATENLANAFAVLNEAPPLWLAEYHDRLLVRLSSLARIHMRRLAEQPRRLPGELWTGTGAFIWARLLRHAVRRCGGTVTGHEHGTGECIIDYFNTKTFSDLESADRFVTFNSNQRRWLEEMIDPRLLVPVVRPRIEVPDYPAGMVRYAGRRPKGVHRPALPGQPRRVMYVGPIYCGFRPRLSHHNADPVLVDWQARLIAQLVSWGCEVLIKPHPEGEQRPPEAFVTALGARFIDGPFEEVWNQADVFIFDWKTTTAFSTAMCTGLPVVVIDFAFETFTPEMDRLVSHHCRMVRGTTDEDNRLQINWDELKNSVLSDRQCDTAMVRETAFRFR